MEARELVSDTFSAVQRLRRQLGRWSATPPAAEAAVFSSGVAALDRILPGGGWRHGMLVEWLADQVAAGGPIAAGASRTTSELPVTRFCGGGMVTLSLLTAREACRAGGELVVIDRWQTFYPSAAAAWGIDLTRLIVVHPRNPRDELWAAVQALRSPAVAAVWAAVDRLDSRAFRRLQLAAQAGRTLGLLLRPSRARGEPSWADVRIEVKKSRVEGQESRARILALDSRLLALDSLRRVQVRVLRCHGGRPGNTVALEIDDATHTVSHQPSAVSYQLSVVSR